MNVGADPIGSNGLGGTTIGELYLLYGIGHKKLESQGIKIFRVSIRVF
jgi:dihydroxyacetone kinase